MKISLILFLALLVWLSVQSPYFLSWQNISLMLVQSVPLAILCFGLVCVIAVGGDDVVSGGIDLSCRRRRCSASRCSASVWPEWHTPYLLLLALLAAVCLLCGAINGFPGAGGRPAAAASHPPTSVAFTGLTDLLTGQRRIAVSDPLMVAFRDNSVLGLPWPLIYLLGVFILFQVPAPPLPLRPACAGGGRQSRYGADERPERAPLDPAGLAVSGHCRRAGYSAAAQPGLRQFQRDGHAAAAGNRAGDLYRRRLLAPSGGHHLGALLGAILVNALSNGLGLLGVNIFWMGAIKGGLILVVLAASAVRHKGGEA